MGELLLCACGFDIRKQRQNRLVGVDARYHRKQRGKGDDLCGHLEALGAEHPQNADQKRRKKRRGGDRKNLALNQQKPARMRNRRKQRREGKRLFRRHARIRKPEPRRSGKASILKYQKRYIKHLQAPNLRC